MTPSTSLGLDRAQAHQLAGQRLDLARPQLGQQDAGLLLAHLGEEDGGLAQAGQLRRARRARRDGGQVRPPALAGEPAAPSRARCVMPCSRVNQPRSIAATSSGRSLTMVEISPRTFCRSAASSSSCAVSILGLLAGALDPQAVELGEHVVGELEGLVVLLDLAAAARAQPDEQDDERDAGRDAAGADHRPHLPRWPRPRGRPPSRRRPASAAVVSNGMAATVMSSPRASSRPTAVPTRSRICCWLRLPATASSMTTETVSRLRSPGAPCSTVASSCRRRCSRSSTPCRRWSRRRRRCPPRRACSPGRGRRRPGRRAPV